jgi:hypothetical protein
MSESAQSSLDTIEQFISEVGPEKVAESSHTEAGGYEGETSHPVKNVDDRTEEAQEGFRSSENTQDAKSEDTGQGKPSVDATEEAKAKVGGDKQAGGEGTAADDQVQIGTNKQPTGDDPSNETSGTKNVKDDDGYDGPSSHPARTDNSELDGHKYASELGQMSMDKLAAEFTRLGTEVCADITNQATAAKQAMSEKKCAKCGMTGGCKCGMDSPAGEEKEASEEDQYLAGQLGWEMASLVTGNFDKQAADSLVHNTIDQIIKTAEDDAVNVASFIQHVGAEQQKQAMGEEDPMGGMGGMPGAEAGGAALPGMGGGGEAPPAAPPAAAAAPPAAMGGMPGGEGGGDAELEQLMQVLDQLGITPEELQAMLAEEAGGAGPEAGGEAPVGGGEEEAVAPGAGGDAGAMEVQASDNATKRAAVQGAVKNYVEELAKRSRNKAAADEGKNEGSDQGDASAK